MMDSMRTLGFCSLIALLAVSAESAFAHPLPAHESHAKPGLQLAEARKGPARDATTGQGALTFRLLHGSEILPEAARKTLYKAHGGFAVDRRRDRGDVYFSLPLAGLMRIDPTLKSVTALNTPPRLARFPFHNTTIWYGARGTPYLTLPSINGAGVFTFTTDGALVDTLAPPTGETRFGVPAVSLFFEEGQRLMPTDVEITKDRMYVTTGYSPLDYILTANKNDEGGKLFEWAPHAFGGKGTKPGQLSTGHGVTLMPDNETLVVADRANDELDYFDLNGKYLKTLPLPTGSRPCDVDFAAGLSVVACLESPGGGGAPVYLMKGEDIVSTILPKDELGLEQFDHIHNAVLVECGETLYLVLQAWNPGDFAILEQVKP